MKSRSPRASILARQPEVSEIVVVDAITDGTPAWCATSSQYPRLRLLQRQIADGWSENHASGLACNKPGDWLLFTDADAEHDPGS